MDSERLQEIKDYWSVERYVIELAYLEISNTILELITALEAAQADATKEKERGDEYDNQLVELHDILTATQTRCLTMENANKDLRAQLAEVNKLYVNRGFALVESQESMQKQDAQLAEAQAEVERLQKDAVELEAAIRKNAKPTGLLI